MILVPYFISLCFVPLKQRLSVSHRTLGSPIHQGWPASEHQIYICLCLSSDESASLQVHTQLYTAAAKGQTQVLTLEGTLFFNGDISLDPNRVIWGK